MSNAGSSESHPLSRICAVRLLKRSLGNLADHLDDERAQQLREQGFINDSATVKHGRAMLNEVFWISPVEVLSEIQAPTLVVHGTKDIEASRAAIQQLRCEHQLVEIEGAQHGFAVHKDPQYLNPQSQEWQAFVIRTVTEWVIAE
jgi:uncharacterized protein